MSPKAQTIGPKPQTPNPGLGFRAEAVNPKPEAMKPTPGLGIHHDEPAVGCQRHSHGATQRLGTPDEDLSRFRIYFVGALIIRIGFGGP